MLRVVPDEPAREELVVDLDEIVCLGARRMLAQALEAEVDAYLAAYAAERDENGRRLVVRNGHARPRMVTTGAGAVEVSAPRVNDKRVDAATGQRHRFRSVILPPWCRKSRKVAEVLPLLYLHGLSTGDFVPALEEFFGTSAGLSASAVSRLTVQWQDEARTFATRDLWQLDFVYVWVDGVHVNVRLEEHRLCILVVVGVRADGRNGQVVLPGDLRPRGLVDVGDPDPGEPTDGQQLADFDPDGRLRSRRTSSIPTDVFDPDGRPRAATVVIRKGDGGVIGT